MPSLKLESVPFTGKALRASKSLSKGEQLEAKKSQDIHLKGIPLLISSKLLRSHQCGQVDIGLYAHQRVTLYEVKCHPDTISKKQHSRLRKSAEFIARVIDSETQIVFIK